jgi:hypothetical protein
VFGGAPTGLVCLALAACTTVAPLQPGVPNDFVFVRDEAGILPADQVRQAEEQLRAIAERTGVYGVVISADEIPDPPRVAGPIIDEISGLGGEALVGFCTPEACDLTAAAAYSVTIEDDLSAVAPAPEPAPGQGVAQGSRGLRAWIELVGTVSTLED